MSFIISVIFCKLQFRFNLYYHMHTFKFSLFALILTFFTYKDSKAQNNNSSNNEGSIYDIEFIDFELPDLIFADQTIFLSGYLKNNGNTPINVTSLHWSVRQSNEEQEENEENSDDGNNPSLNESSPHKISFSAGSNLSILQPGEEIYFETELSISNDNLKVGDENIIVIWPSMNDQNPLNSTFEKSIYVTDETTNMAMSTPRVSEESDKNSIDIYPNPVNNHFVVSSQNESTFTWYLYDICGQLVQESEKAVSREVVYPHATTGTYIIHILHESGERQQQKLLIR